MKLPYHYRLTFKTLLSAAEINAALTRHALTSDGASPNAKDAALRQAAITSGAEYLYRAELSATGFQLFTCYRNSDFDYYRRPLCRAVYYPYGTGCRFELTFKAILFVRIFMFIWGNGALLGFCSIFFGSLSAGKYQDALITPFAFSPFALGFWVFHRVLFENDVTKCLRFLHGIGIIGKR